MSTWGEDEARRRRRRLEARRRDRRRARRRRALTVGALGLATVAVALSLAPPRDPRAPALEARAAAHASRPVLRRSRPARRPTFRERAVAWARARRGDHEVGTTNCSPAIARWERHMGLPVPAAPPCRPWCGAFLHEAFLRAGVDLTDDLIDPNATYWDARVGRHRLHLIDKRRVRAGDLVFLKLDPTAPADAVASHAALVTGPPHHGKVPTAEGNVGHHVVLTRRGLRFIAAAARVRAG